MTPQATVPVQPTTIKASGLTLRHWRGWLAEVGVNSYWLHQELQLAVNWSQPLLRVYGKVHPVPRLSCWIGDRGCSYRYSGVLHQPEDWISPLEELRDVLENHFGYRFNSLLLNRYRDGQDRMGWHADDEPELIREHPIASISLGASRAFRFRPRSPFAKHERSFNLILADGDLLIMDPPTQQHWQHCLPTRRNVTAERLNLTFRRIAINKQLL